MHYLVATDGSSESTRALECALEFAAAMDASVTVAHVVSPEITVEGVEPIRSLADADRRLLLEGVEDAEVRGEAILEEASRRGEKRGVGLETDVLYGRPVDSLVTYVDAGEFDHLFVGTRGLSGRAETLLGSVAYDLVRRASLPVTVVR
ncbi:universal stress protein [Natronobiforma cellulositropha]|uniref:universal stress protein n=1 Tax=Natronobiforma cellulositropha TaxID=1679076 RepID=UPI0021D5DB8D|nr:universal stress protein [Natronobiforma cellulositropha]